LATLGGVLRLRRCIITGLGGGGGAPKLSDCTHHLASVPEDDANLLQALIGKLR
jgi:hypothetical protein